LGEEERERSADPATAAVDTVEESVLNWHLTGSRENGITCTTVNGIQSSSLRLMKMLARLGITNRQTAFQPPVSNNKVERFQRSLKEDEEFRSSKYQRLTEARD